MTSRRRKAIIRRRIFIAVLSVLLAMVLALVAACSIPLINFLFAKEEQDNVSTGAGSTSSVALPSEIESSQEATSSEPEIITTPTGVELDANFGRLLLINGKNPLPEDYDTNVREYLVEIDEKTA